ncbi:uncharacterized protein LOC6566090 [Drosophila grimshawi]|uniref:GH24464 n=1 Tax=Drosophila grimshawi TaxID=7222 RepID=B4JLR5_DROGR|nr:uncharacterized protein LOC6566090 [Drosophila grimshawi]EDV91676.1 GH24464 [Drosophila grimshawi]
MQHSADDDLIRYHIYLASNVEYSTHLLKLCEHCVQNEKKVLLLTENCEMLYLVDTMEKPRSLAHMERCMSIVALKEIESAPRHIIELFDCLPRPQLIVFDMNSIVAAELISNTQLQILIRHMAKCAAAFCNYMQMQNMFKHACNIDAIVIMPTAKYPLTSAHLKLLIGLYFSTNPLYTNFAALVESIRQSQSLH